MEENQRYKIGGISFIILGIGIFIILLKFKIKFISPDFELFIIALLFILLGASLYIMGKKTKK